jgi:predicted ATPase
LTGQVQSLTVEGFRSIQSLDIKFDKVNLITGPNGCGKSNLFNAFRLVKAAMQGRLASAIVEQGGMESILWAGHRRQGPVRMRVAIVAEPFEYVLELGLRPRSEFPLFPLDPQIKQEIVKLGGKVMVDRKTSTGRIQGLGTPGELRTDLIDSESIFAQIRDPERYPYLYTLREAVDRWVFYHEFRTDSASPIRRPAVATYAPRLNEDGSNLAPAVYVVEKRGEKEQFLEVLEEAFPGADLIVEPDQISMSYEGIHRPLTLHELSDGTIKFICLAAAGFAIHHPPLIAFNEPESSLNPRLYGPLADVFTHASQFSQLWITTHSEGLAKAITDRLDCHLVRLDKVDGQTVIGGTPHGRSYDTDE